MEKALLVREGHWGRIKEGDCDGLIELIKRKLIEAGAEVEVVQTFDDAHAPIKQGEVSTLVFISRGMLQSARQVKDSYPNVRVVVFTGLVPCPGEYPFSINDLVIIDKGKILKPNLPEIIFSA